MQQFSNFLDASVDAVQKRNELTGAIKKFNNAPKSARAQILKEVAKTKSNLIMKSSDFVLGCVFLLLFFVISVPFGTDQAENLTTARVYWGCGTILYYVGVYFTLPYLIRLRLTVVSLQLFYLLMIAFYSVCAIALIYGFFHFGMGLNEFRVGQATIFMVLVVAALVYSTTYANCRYRLLTEDQSEGLSVFMDRLPHHIRGRLISLQANDHYLMVITDNGSDLIRMNLHDALDMLDNDDGLQVHRSHWISTLALNVSKYDAKHRDLHLPDGQILPVSKSRTMELLNRLAQTPAGNNE